MRKTLLARAIAGVCAASGADYVFAQAAEEKSDIPSVVITGTPLGSSLFELVPPADVLTGKRLLWQRKSSIGETLEGMPGVGSTYFGPHASRPVIRGLDGDRIRILQNGTGTLDVSSLSFDHALPYDPLAAERIEIVRGPAAVLYGGNAVGGVVNVIDNRIPSAPLVGFSGRAEPRFGGPDRERSWSGLLEAGNGIFALHGDVFERKTKDLRIPGFARSARQRALDAPGTNQPRDTLPNSNARSDGGTVGGSLTLGNGYVGLSHGSYASNYGSVAEPAVRLDMMSERNDIAGEVREIAPMLKAIKFKLGHTDYQHREFEAGALNVTFKNNGSDGRMELVHDKLGPLQGALGLTLANFDVSALGAEAFVPLTHTRARGLFLYEELPMGDWKFSFGLRNESTRVGSAGGGPADPATGQPRFNPVQTRSFNANSSAFGVLYSLRKDLALVANASFTQRAPTYYELFTNGQHAATGTFEIGNPSLGVEKSRSFDIGLRWRGGPHSAGVSVYRTNFDNFITPFATGNTRAPDADLNPAADPANPGFTPTGERILPEFVYRGVPAAFQGFEAQGRFRVYERTGALDLLVRGDYVKAYNRDTSQPLPRIPPLRLGVGLEYTLNRFTAAVDLQRAQGQSRVAANERPTDGYTLVNGTLAYNVKAEPVAMQVFVRADNLFNQEARNHMSILKDIAPLPGRGFLVGLRASF